MTTLYAHATGPWPANHYATPALAIAAASVGDILYITEPGSYAGSAAITKMALVEATVPGVIWAGASGLICSVSGLTVRNIAFSCGNTSNIYYFLICTNHTGVTVENCTFYKGIKNVLSGGALACARGNAQFTLNNCVFLPAGVPADVPGFSFDSATLGYCDSRVILNDCALSGFRCVDITAALSGASAQSSSVTLNRCTLAPTVGPAIADAVGVTISAYDCEGPNNAALGISITGARATLGTIQGCSLGGFACAAGKSHGGVVANNWLNTVDVSGAVTTFNSNGYETLTAGTPDSTNRATTTAAAFTTYPEISTASTLQGKGNPAYQMDIAWQGRPRTSHADIGCFPAPFPQLRDTRRRRANVASWQRRAA